MDTCASSGKPYSLLFMESNSILHTNDIHWGDRLNSIRCHTSLMANVSAPLTTPTDASNDIRFVLPGKYLYPPLVIIYFQFFMHVPMT
jgi:hypothetical protein